MNPDQEGRGAGSRDTAQAGRPGLRGLRAAVFAVVCVLTALAMHVLAGGPAAGLGTVAAATAVTGAGAFVLARRRRSTGTLLAAAFAAQYGMHQLFSTDLPHAPHHLIAGHHQGGLSAGAGMFLAHVLVATLSAWWLDRGETVLATLLLLLACSLRGLLWPPPATPSTPPPAPLRPMGTAGAGILTSQVLAWALCRRGPPR
ncbi:hypothetical protein [Nonomuraea insulae]|uniref:MFS transporter n=1 Tax=Nonomuraea insulae TaxID=1616787 RepID=A0ABW1CG95_9ACTN